MRGTQQLEWFGKSEFEGVYGLWYGKGIGVDRACESLKLGNLEGASANGGFLAIAGDDHGGKSSDSAHQSEHTLIAAMLPRSEEHTSELQSLMRISYAVFCLKKKKNYTLKINERFDRERGETIYTYVQAKRNMNIHLDNWLIRHKRQPPTIDNTAQKPRQATSEHTTAC